MEQSLQVDHGIPQSNTPIATYNVRGGGGTRLHARAWGNPNGRALLFVHGWSQSQRCWGDQVNSELADDFYLVTFDNRGHGMSDRPAAADGYGDAQLWADDLAAIIDATELERPIVVGWSYGGFIVADYVRAYGENAIAGVNLVGGAVTLQPPTFDHLGLGLLANAQDACAPDLDTSIPAMLRFLQACTARPLAPDDWNRIVAWNMTVPPEVRGALIAREINSDDVLSTLTIPMLVTHGRADDIVLPTMAEHVATVCKTAQVSWYDGVGHMPFVEDAARFNRELADFAGRVG